MTIESKVRGMIEAREQKKLAYIAEAEAGRLSLANLYDCNFEIDREIALLNLVITEEQTHHYFIQLTDKYPNVLSDLQMSFDDIQLYPLGDKWYAMYSLTGFSRVLPNWLSEGRIANWRKE